MHYMAINDQTLLILDILLNVCCNGLFMSKVSYFLIASYIIELIAIAFIEEFRFLDFDGEIMVKKKVIFFARKSRNHQESLRC